MWIILLHFYIYIYSTAYNIVIILWSNVLIMCLCPLIAGDHAGLTNGCQI